MISQNAMAIVAGIGLAIWVLGPLYAVLAPTRQHDPQRGQAVGCLMLIMIPGILLALMLIAGLIGNVPTLIRIPYYVVVVPLVLLAFNGVGIGLFWLSKRIRGVE